jgi:hypothetical protein
MGRETILDWLTDLTPFFADGCWQFVLLARNAAVGVVVRGGPSKWWHLTLWNTRQDRFSSGQWFRGSLYLRKCDLSPDGQFFSCFAGKYQRGARDRGYGDTWVAVSRPPYFTALALWPVGETWGGHTMFMDDGTFHSGTLKAHHPDHPPGPLHVVPHSFLKLDDPFLWIAPWENTGWRPVRLPDDVKKTSYFDQRVATWRKTAGKLCLTRSVDRADDKFPSRRPSLYTISKGGESTELALFEAHWADFDQRGRLVATAGGSALEGKIDRHRGLQWHRLAAFQDERPERVETPGWAQHW